jgi:predicted amidohydrolase YtcJ
VPGGRLLVKGRIRTMHKAGHVASWMVVEDGRIVDLGAGPAPGDDAGPVLDLTDAAIIPMLHDCHVHFLQTGLMELDVDLGRATRFDEMIQIIADAGRGRREGMLRAHSFDPDLMPDGRYPTMAELDAAVGSRPLFVKRRDGHSSILNASAWELLALPDGTPGIERDSAGRPTGTLREGAHTFAVRKVESYLTREERVECFRRAAALAARRGIGVVHALAGSMAPDNRDVELLLEIRDDLPIETVVYAQMEDVERVAGLGLPRIGGCLLLDGSFSSGTAALAEPYADRAGNGVLYYEDEHLTSFFSRAHAGGLQISVHALGGRAIAQALRCYAAACGDEIRNARHRIEHCELPDPSQIAAIAETGISPCVQPSFEFMWGGLGGMMEKRLGPERIKKTNPHRTMLDAGIPLAGGSDSYVTPMDSLLGIHAAVNRPNVSERLSVFDAIGLFTSGAARISFDEDRRGTLEKGKDASFTVLARDPFEVPADELRDIGVLGLFVRGEQVFGPDA